MIEHPYHFQGSPAVAALSLFAASLGIASIGLESQHPMFIAAISPQEAAEWLTVVKAAANALFTVLNTAMGLWHAGQLVHRHRRRKPKPKAKSNTPPDRQAGRV